jgi:hypothetical protein
MKRDIRACSRSELDEINREIAKYKAIKSGVIQSDVSTQLDDEEQDSIAVEVNADENRVPIKAEQGATINAEQLDLF